MTTQLPSLPTADPARLNAIDPQDLVLACLAFEHAATAATLAQRLKPWGAAAADVSVALDALAQGGLVETACARWTPTAEGEAQAARRFDLDAPTRWQAFAECQFPALALGIDPAQPGARAYLAQARNFYAATLAALFDLADPATLPGLNAVRVALVWRIVAARCPDLLPTEAPDTMTGLTDPLTRALYVRFSGLTRGSVDQATPALMRRVLPGPIGAGVAGLRRAVVRVSLSISPGSPAEMVSRQPSTPPEPDEPADFAAAITTLARKLKTPKAKGGHFAGGQVAIAQLYDAYTAQDQASLSLDDFKARLWAAVRAGADFHLTRLDIPALMDDDLRKRSATPTRAGDVVHFVVVD
jgi:hypothetical protein